MHKYLPVRRYNTVILTSYTLRWICDEALIGFWGPQNVFRGGEMAPEVYASSGSFAPSAYPSHSAIRTSLWPSAPIHCSPKALSMVHSNLLLDYKTLHTSSQN